MKNSNNVLKCVCFWKMLQWRTQIFWWHEGTVSVGVWCKNIFPADLLGIQYLFEILQTSLTVKNGENEVKSRFFEKYLRWRAPIFFLKWRMDVKFLVQKHLYSAKLLGGWYLFEKWHTSSTVKTAKNVSTCECF